MTTTALAHTSWCSPADLHPEGGPCISAEITPSRDITMWIAGEPGDVPLIHIYAEVALTAADLREFAARLLAVADEAEPPTLRAVGA